MIRANDYDPATPPTNSARLAKRAETEHQKVAVGSATAVRQSPLASRNFGSSKRVPGRCDRHSLNAMEDDDDPGNLDLRRHIPTRRMVRPITIRHHVGIGYQRYCDGAAVNRSVETDNRS